MKTLVNYSLARDGSKHSLDLELESVQIAQKFFCFIVFGFHKITVSFGCIPVIIMSCSIVSMVHMLLCSVCRAAFHNVTARMQWGVMTQLVPQSLIHSDFFV